MGLWEPGTIEGLTVSMIQRVTARAHEDHDYQPRECDCRDDDNMRAGEPCAEWCSSNRAPIAPMLAPHAMTVNAIESPQGDNAFDRCSHARWEGERFAHATRGGTWVVADYVSRWRIRETESGETEYVGETELARWIVASCGEHPDPYIALVEVTYDVAGHRAGYGVRRSGAVSLWYD